MMQLFTRLIRTATLALFVTLTSAAAPMHEVVASFDVPPRNPGYGALVLGPDGQYWGTTTGGGVNSFPTNFGTIFKVRADGSDWSTVLSFSDNGAINKGANPNAALVSDGGGFLWGTTQQGGVNGVGTVFKVNATNGMLTTVVQFTRNGTSNKGAYPYSALVNDGNGFFWGTTQQGGANGYGTIFKVNGVTGALATVVEFSGNGASNKGALPAAGLVSDGSGFFWGTTAAGGASDFGTVFKVSALTGALTTLVEFTWNGASNRGGYPRAVLVNDGSGSFWGTAQQGGASGFGTVFKVNALTGALTTLVEFTGNGSSNKGTYPAAGLVRDGSGFLWGTTQQGGANGYGTLFKVSAFTGALTTVVQFTGDGASNRGAHPYAGLLSDGHGFLWGATQSGGAKNYGTIFKVNASTGDLTTLVEFAKKGNNPSSGLVSDGRGFLWGTTQEGGGNGYGTVFKVNAATRAVTTVVEFSWTGAINAGRNPIGGLVSDGRGFFWGTTIGGGGSDSGTVFKVDAITEKLTTVITFTGTGTSNRGAKPYAELINDGSGFLWGTTQQGGSKSAGTVFKVNTATGELTTVVEFTQNEENNKGALPVAGLVSDGSGFFWGTTTKGGATDMGTVFKINAVTGELTTLVEFTSNGAINRGGWPYAGLVSDGSGFLWGTTSGGGSGNATNGTVFKVNVTSGVLTTVVGFTGNGTSNKGAIPYGALESDGTGFFWGTTSEGGTDNYGTLFKVNAATGVLTTMVQFTGTGRQANAGMQPSYGSLLKYTDGYFYGTTKRGGPGGAGTIFRYGPVSTAPVLVLLGSTALTIEAAAIYTDAGATANDEEEGALTPTNTSNTVVSNVPGTYAVKWMVMDSFGLESTATRAVTVVDTTQPTIRGTFAPLSIGVGAALPDYTTQAVTSDIVGVTSVTQSPPPGTRAIAGTMSVTLTAHDVAGNTASVSFDVTLDPVSTLLASKNRPVPGAGVAGSGIPAGAEWASFGVPSVNDAGEVAFLGIWKSPTGGGTGIFRSGSESVALQMVASKGSPAPGIANAVIGAMKDPLLGPDGSLAWVATLANTKGTTGAVTSADDVAIYLDADGSGPNPAVLVARKGAIATGAAASLIVPPGVKSEPEWGAFMSVALGKSALAFTATLAKTTPGLKGAPGPGGVTSATDAGLWVFDRGTASLSLALRDGGTVLGSTIKTIDALVARPVSPGQGRGVESDNDEDYAVFRVTLADTRQAAGYVGVNGTPTFSYIAGTAAPDYGAGALWKSFGLPTQAAGSNAMAFVGTVRVLTGTATSANNTAIFAEDDVNYQAAVVVKKGDATDVSGGVFSVFKDPVNGQNRSVAFVGTMKPNTAAEIGAANNDGIWVSDDANGLSLVAREGAQPPEAPDGARWKTFNSLAMPPGSRPMFVATMHSKVGTAAPGPGGVTAANDTGLWAMDSTGAVRLLIREGDAIGSSNVKVITVLSTVSGSPAQTRSFQNGGGVILRVTDATGATHLVRIAVP